MKAESWKIEDYISPRSALLGWYPILIPIHRSTIKMKSFAAATLLLATLAEVAQGHCKWL